VEKEKEEEEDSERMGTAEVAPPDVPPAPEAVAAAAAAAEAVDRGLNAPDGGPENRLVIEFPLIAPIPPVPTSPRLINEGVRGAFTEKGGRREKAV